MNDLFVAPNPFSVPAEFELKIDGLARNSSIKILSVDGRLVRSFSSPGGRIAHWDGRDEAGRHVASGVYIVVGYSEDGSEVGKAKVTVIRR
jgi:flagellar hook assembly protein FlgD